MGTVSKTSGLFLTLALLAVPATGSLAAQEQDQDTSGGEVMATVYGTIPPALKY